MNILHTVPHTCPRVLTRRISLIIKSFLVGDNFLYSCDLDVSFRGDVVSINQMLVTLRNQRFKVAEAKTTR